MKYKEIAKRISVLRDEMGFSQSELGREINVYPQNISAWENGRRRPDIESCKKLIDLARKHNITIDIDYLRPSSVSGVR
jgi:DNA-binding XRE family transcriptional regulator